MGGVKIPFGDEFVKNGEACWPYGCAIAIAINAALGPEFWSSVTQKTIAIYRGGDHTCACQRAQVARVPTPQHVALFINGIDKQPQPPSGPFVPRWPEGVRRFTHFTLPIDLEKLKGASVEPS